MTTSVTGVLLAGGKSERMGGGDKSLLMLGGKPLLSHAIERLRPQVAALVLNANGDAARFAAFGLPVVADASGDFSGPLAGILAGMRWSVGQAPAARWIATVATDTPFVPLDLVTRLLAASSDPATIRLAASRGRVHQVIGLWPVDLAPDLAHRLASGGSKSVLGWVETRRWLSVDFDASGAVDPFVNINTPEDLARARSLMDEFGNRQRVAGAAGQD